MKNRKNRQNKKVKYNLKTNSGRVQISISCWYQQTYSLFDSLLRYLKGLGLFISSATDTKIIARNIRKMEGVYLW